MKPLRQLAALVIAAAFTLGAGKPTPANWLAAVKATPEGSHVIGNPQAKVKLVEYVSYTCPHCAAFEAEATGELALGFIRPGTGSIEYRPYLRNVVDVAATLLVACGDPAKFPGNHSAVLRGQKKWMQDVSEAEQRRWVSQSDFGSRMRAIASDMHLYEIFETRGYGRPELDRCLADEALARHLSQENQTAANAGGINGTPSFLINDRLQDSHDWASLRPALKELTR